MACLRRLGRRRLAGGIECEGQAQHGVLGILASNVLWGIWGVYSSAWALIALQVCLAAMNLRGLGKTKEASSQN